MAVQRQLIERVRRLTAAFALLLLSGPALAAFQGNANFRNVAITSAAQYREDWRTCSVSGSMDWSQAETLGDGIIYLPLKLTTAGGWARQMYCHAVRVDTSKSSLRFTGSDRCAGWGEPNTEFHPDNKTILKNTVREKTADFLARFRGDKSKGGRGMDIVFAVNGQGWGGTYTGTTWSGTTETITYTFTSGWAKLNYLQYSEGIQISNASTGNAKSYCPGVFVVWKDGTIDIVDTIVAADIPRIWCAITPHICRLMTDGEITVKRYVSGEYVDYSSDTTVRPRTAYGISSDKRYFYAVVLDGDAAETWSQGATFLDTAKVMNAAGCYQALNMDGGGSSNIVGWDYDYNRPKVLGRPGDGGFSVNGQRDGGSQIGIYYAPIVAMIGSWRYDSADALIGDIDDGELPDGAKEADVIGNLVFSSERPTLASGSKFTFASTNWATVGWSDGEGRVAAGSRVGFRGVRFASGSRTISVAAGGQISVENCPNLEKIKTADSQGFVLASAPGHRLTIDCATAQVAGTAFGLSELPYEETLRQLTNLVCAASSEMLAYAERVDGRTVLKWGSIAFSANAVRARADDQSAVVTVSIAAVSPAITEENLKVSLTVSNDDGTSVDTYTQDFIGAGSYSFRPKGTGFGYSYHVTLADGDGAELPNAGVADGIIVFGRDSEWFSADCQAGTVRGGQWTSSEVFTADESGKSGRIRIVTDVVVSDDSASDEAEIEKVLSSVSGGDVHSALMLQGVGTVGIWKGLVNDGETIAWRTLVGDEVELGDPCEYVLITEVDFSSGSPRVRYYAGSKASGTATLLADSSGNKTFGGAGQELAVRGVVSLERFDSINTLVGIQRVKCPSGCGFYLTNTSK